MHLIRQIGLECKNNRSSLKNEPYGYARRNLALVLPVRKGQNLSMAVRRKPEN